MRRRPGDPLERSAGSPRSVRDDRGARRAAPRPGAQLLRPARLDRRAPRHGARALQRAALLAPQRVAAPHDPPPHLSARRRQRLSLWELVHNAGRDGTEQHELYAEEAEARLAASRLPSGPSAGRPAGARRRALPRRGRRLRAAERPARPPDTRPAPDVRAGQLRRPRAPRPAPRGERRPAGRGDGPPPPARLRPPHHPGLRPSLPRGRRPGRRLHPLRAPVPAARRQRGQPLGGRAHGDPDGRHMCEVYEDEATARGAMETRARVR